MSYKLYADNQCIDEIFSANELREMTGCDKVRSEKEKKIYNCPNCGAPVSSYICEYCGTEFEKPKKVLTDEEKRNSFAEFIHEQNLAQMQASQEWQTQQILNSLNISSSQIQTANIRDSVNVALFQSQICNGQDRAAAYQTQIISSPYQGPLVDEASHKMIEQEADKLARYLNIFAISLLFLFIISLVYTAFHFLP